MLVLFCTRQRNNAFIRNNNRHNFHVLRPHYSSLTVKFPLSPICLGQTCQSGEGGIFACFYPKQFIESTVSATIDADVTL